MNWNVITAEHATPQRWRNNGGRTRELLAWPDHVDWNLRISVADIESDGAFSEYPGVDRWLGVIRGHGVRLLGKELRVGDPLLCFDGEQAPDCELLDGPTLDFNVMHRRGKGQVQVTPAFHDCEPDPRAAWFGVFTPQGGRLSSGMSQLILPPLALAWREQGVAQVCSFSAVSTPSRFATGSTAWWITWLPT